MPRGLLSLILSSAFVAAQDPPVTDWNAYLRQRIQQEKDLIELRYRRDEQGQLQVASCEHGARPFEAMFPIAAPLRGGMTTGRAYALLALLGQGTAGLLGLTDAERHLGRAGIETSPVALRQFLVAPISSEDRALARVELLDRLVAIDWLQQGRHEGAVAELTALSARADTAPLLAQRARVALAAFGRSAAPTRHRLAPETLLFPTVADVYVAIDHARMPDFSPLPALARRLAIDRSYGVVERLQAPTPDDLYFGQFLADLMGELPFEAVRRYGNVRLDHTVVTLLAQSTAARVPFGWNLQAAGEFEPAQFAAAIDDLAAIAQEAIKVTRRPADVHVASPDGEVALGPTLVRTWSKGLAGRARPDLARELLAEGPGIRVVVLPTSKVWLGLASLELPPAERAEITAWFGEEFRLCASITARDEDAAEAWVERGKQLLADGLEQARTVMSGWNGPKDVLQPFFDAIAATKITADGVRVEAVLTSKAIAWSTLWALRRASR